MTGTDEAESLQMLYEGATRALRGRLRFLGLVIGLLSLSVAILMAVMIIALVKHTNAGPSFGVIVAIASQAVLFIGIIVVLAIRMSNTGRAVALGIVRFGRFVNARAASSAAEQMPLHPEAIKITQSLISDARNRRDVAVVAVFFGLLCLVTSATLYLPVWKAGVGEHPFIYLLALVGCVSASSAQIILRKPSNAQVYLEAVLDWLDTGGPPVPLLREHSLPPEAEVFEVPSAAVAGAD